MSGINQIQMSFSSGEDRILLRMNTLDSTGFQFWLTRRYVKLLWPVLLDMLIKDEQIAIQKSEIAKKEVLSFQHQEAAQKMDYSQTYQTQSENEPLGSEPVLLGKIAVNTREDGTRILCMHPDQGQGVELALNQVLLHSFCKLMQDTVAKADWGLNLSEYISAAPQVADREPRTIN